MDDSITITKKQYDQLMRDSAWLAALEEAGVDNWSGISYAYELYDEEDEED